MSGSDLQGRWMPSSVTEEDVLKLREAKFSTTEIWHRFPAQRQAIPNPQPGESVVFMSHFLRGLGFPMDPFVRGLLFYYGLEFHDLAPESILHISSFIVVCEAFLRVTPHFGLWLKTFGVEPKMIEGRHADCGGAVISKNADAPWPEGSFQEVVATRVVLYHRSQEHQVGGASCLSLGSPTTASVMGQQRIRLGVIQRRALVAGPH